MTQWTLQVPDETDRSVQRYLAHAAGAAGELSAFVDQAVRAEILRRTVRDIQDSNSDLAAEDAQALANEAVTWARGNPS